MCFFVVQSYVCIQFVDFFIVYANIYDHIYIYIQLLVYIPSSLYVQLFNILMPVVDINFWCTYLVL